MRIAQMQQIGSPTSVADIRREKLRAWIAVHCNGLQAEFLGSCAKNGYELSQSELSGLLRTKSFGEKKARAIERGAGMPLMYLDTPALSGGRKSALLVAEPEPASKWIWPFKDVRPEQYALLDHQQRTDIEKYVLLQVKTRDPPAQEKQRTPATKPAKVRSA